MFSAVDLVSASVKRPHILLVILARLARSAPFDLAQDCRGVRPQLFGGCAGEQFAQQISHRRGLREQWTIPDRQVATDHAAVAIDQAVGDAVHVRGKRPRAR